MYLLTLLLWMVSTPQPGWLEESRVSFFRFGTVKCEAENLYKQLDRNSKEQSALLLAYKGMARASMAEGSFNPVTKFNRVNEGKKMIEDAVRSEPDNPEIRLMRLSVQVNVPDFLSYSSDIANDRSSIIKAIEQNPRLFNDIDFTLKVINFVAETAKPTESERRIINNISKKLTDGR